MIDLYFEPNYGKLYEKMENGESIVFKYNGEHGTITHMFIKRLIPIKVDGQSYYDLVTPYGYGGPLITECKEGQKNELVKEFEFEFEKYCKENNIVSEFVRFHPVIGNTDDFRSCYMVSDIRNTIGTNLKDSDDPFQSEFSKSCRKNIRRALRDEISFRITEKPDNVQEFKKIYYSTMERNEADEYYYFDDDYFNKCVQFFKENIVLVEAIYKQQTIAMGLYFTYNKTIHIHLSGTLSEYLFLSPAYVLRYAITMWGKEKGYELIHHGGGRSNSLEDNLYLFKKQFGKTEFKFSIGKKIWNCDIYNELCKITGADSNGDFFPAYRGNIGTDKE